VIDAQREVEGSLKVTGRGRGIQGWRNDACETLVKSTGDLQGSLNTTQNWEQFWEESSQPTGESQTFAKHIRARKGKESHQLQEAQTMHETREAKGFP